MSFVHFIHVESDDNNVFVNEDKVVAVRRIARATPGLRRGLLYLPATARDFYTDDGPSPRLALQLYYDTLEELEEAISGGGQLQSLADTSLWQGLPGLRISHQVMVVRDYSLAANRNRPLPVEGQLCSYLVHYPGRAEDFNAWLNYYLDHHPQILRTFDGLREIEVYTRVDWRDALPWEQVHYMQRNRLIFDNAAALEAALNSPKRHESRADFEKFPAFTGSNIHYPMLTEELAL